MGLGGEGPTKHLFPAHCVDVFKCFQPLQNTEPGMEHKRDNKARLCVADGKQKEGRFS